MQAGTVEKSRQTAVGSQLIGCADRQFPAWLHEPQTVGQLQSELQIVRGKEDGLVGLMSQTMQQLQHIHLAGIVQEGGWLVEIDDGRLLSQCLGNHGFLPLAVAQRTDVAVGQLFNAHLTDGLITTDEVGVAEPPQKPV